MTTEKLSQGCETKMPTDMGRKWRPWPGGECPHCGDSLEVLTNEAREYWACVDDPLRCVACGCPGYITEYDDECVTENMHDEPDCDCEWCLAHPVDGCTCGHCYSANSGLGISRATKEDC